MQNRCLARPTNSKNCIVTVYDPVYRTESSIIGKVVSEQVTNTTRTYRLAFASLVPNGSGLGPEADVVRLTVPRKAPISSSHGNIERSIISKTKQQQMRKGFFGHSNSFAGLGPAVCSVNTSPERSKARKLAVTFQVPNYL